MFQLRTGIAFEATYYWPYAVAEINQCTQVKEKTQVLNGVTCTTTVKN